MALLVLVMLLEDGIAAWRRALSSWGRNIPGDDYWLQHHAHFSYGADTRNLAAARSGYADRYLPLFFSV